MQLETVANYQPDGYYLRQFSMGEHSATHLNAPRSFYPNGVGVDQYPAPALVLPAVVLDGKAACAVNPDYTLQLSDIQTWEWQHGMIRPGCLVLFFTGWQTYWVDPEKFINQQHFPGFDMEAVEFLLEERQIAGIGIDTHGVDSGQDATFAVNRRVLAQKGIVLENLTNLDQLPPKGTTLAIGVLRLQNGSGSPASILAFVP